MIIIGERINSTRSSISKAIRNRDSSFIEGEAERQIRSGASILDVNCAMGLENEHQDLDWTISVIQSAFPDTGICIDSPNYRAIEAALKVYKGTGAIFINSITGDESRIDAIIPLALRYNARVIALTMDEHGMPDTVARRIEIARSIVAMTTARHLPENVLYFDPLVRPVSTDPEQARYFLESLPLIKKLGQVQTICGLSNVSFGLPRRSLINAAFLGMSIFNGIDACIMDPVDRIVMSSFRASEAIIGKDEFCAAYIGSYREGTLIS